MDARLVPNQLLEHYFMKYKDMVYRVARTLVQQADADDVLQDVFMKLVRNVLRLENDEHVKNWLLRVTKTTCYDRLNSKHNKVVPFDDLRLKSDQDEGDPKEDSYADVPEVELDFEIEDDRAEKLPEALDLLKADQRYIIHLYYYEEISIREIAQVLGISESAAKVRLFRARDALKRKIEEVCGHENA